MSREKGRRTWIKLHTYGRLHGSVVHQLEEAEQSVWDKLLCFAGEINRDGQISDNDGRPYPHPFIAAEIHTTPALLESTLAKCFDEGRITEDETGLHITNWKHYQSEYQRQKPYRQNYKVKDKTNKYCPECGYHAHTDDKFCPDCAGKGKDVELQVDFTGRQFQDVRPRKRRK
jgi:hypothetical protein